MLFRQIKYFLTIADSGSFSEAAAQCFISQSAVSQQISALETELGVKLLERTPRGVILTEAGRYLYEHGKKLISEAEKLKQGVQAAAYKSEERFSVAYLTGSAPEYLPRALCAFKKLHKDIAVDVYGTGFLNAFADLDSGRADIVLAARSFGDGFEEKYLYSTPCFAAISSMYSCEPQEFVTAADLKDLPCIIVAENNDRDAEQRYLREFFGMKNSFLVAASEEEAELMVAAGNGFMLTDNEEPHPGIKKVPFYTGGSRAERRYYLYTDNCTNKYVQDFIQIMLRLCATQQPDEVVE